jgi:hypothetical protein
MLQENEDEMKFNGTYQILVSSDSNGNLFIENK